MTFDDALHFKPHSIPQKHALGYQSGEPKKNQAGVIPAFFMMSFWVHLSGI